MNLIDFTKIGGYRLKQATLSKMQVAYFWILKLFVGFINIPDTGNYILSGCLIIGENITDGILYIDGELCPFTQAPGNTESKIKKQVEITSLSFKSGTNEPVFRKTTAVVHADGVALSSFTRLKYVATDNNFTSTLLNKLTAIENGAQVNIHSNWNETNPSSKAFILNKPTNHVRDRFALNAEYVIFGDNSFGWLVTHNLGTSDYVVFAECQVQDEMDENLIPSYAFTIHEKGDNSFRVKSKKVTSVPDATVKITLKIYY